MTPARALPFVLAASRHRTRALPLVVAVSFTCALATVACTAPAGSGAGVAEGESGAEGEGGAAEGESGAEGEGGAAEGESGGEGEGAVDGEGAAAEGEGEGEGAHVGRLVGGPGPSPGAIAGVTYTSASSSGVTGADGSFDYTDGDLVTFSVGDVVLATIPGAALISPFQLASCAYDADLDRVIVALFGGTVAEARDTLARQVDAETWSEIGVDVFHGLDALGRGQGVATDGVHWFFSGWSLEATGQVSITDTDYNVIDSASIPLAEVLADKTDHMGDIDFYDGHIYAPLEDGKDGYLHPRVQLVDAASLDFGTEFSIDTALQSAGVPWIAVDPARGFAYLAEWQPTTALHRFDLDTLAYVDDLAIVPPAGFTLGRIQGAKVYGGALYLSTDDDTKGIYKLDLDTGTLIALFAMSAASEEEGLAVWARPDGSILHTLNVGAGSTSSELHHHALVTPSLRAQLCP